MSANDLRPTVFRAGTVLEGHEVLVVDGRIAAIGVDLVVPGGTDEIDARGYGADWTLTQYFVWYYLNWGKKFRPEDIHAGNLLGALEALDAGVTTCVDWSHGLQTIDHADARGRRARLGAGKVRAGLRQHPGRARELDGHPELRKFFDRRSGDLEGTTGDDAVRLIHEHGYGEARTVYVHASTLSADSYAGIAATGGSVSVSTESEQSAGLVRNDDSPAMTPLLNPHGHVVLHAQRADVDTVLVDGRIVKRDHRLVGADLAGARRAVEATHGDPVVKR